MPLISIIIPSYNQAEFLRENICSFLAQAFTDWELLIVDDESTDGSLELARSFSNKHDNITVLEKKNGGLSSARNHGIRYSQGDYLYFIDADDRVMPDFFNSVSAAIFKYTPDVIQFGYRYLLQEDGRVLHTVYPQNRLKVPEIYKGSPGSCHSFVVHREMISRAGNFDEKLKSVEDWDFWIRIAKCEPKVSVIPLPLVDYRLHPLSMSRNYMVMYNSFKHVAFTAVRNNDRLSGQVLLNTTCAFDVKPIVKKSLLRFTAVAVLKGNIDSAVSFFKEESCINQWRWEVKEFSEMNSYLTFRYRYSKEDIQWVFTQVVPLFVVFFNRIGYNHQTVKKIMVEVFRYHLYSRNRLKYGLAGKLLNNFSIYPGISFRS